MVTSAGISQRFFFYPEQNPHNPLHYSQPRILPLSVREPIRTPAAAPRGGVGESYPASKFQQQ